MLGDPVNAVSTQRHTDVVHRNWAVYVGLDGGGRAHWEPVSGGMPDTSRRDCAYCLIGSGLPARTVKQLYMHYGVFYSEHY